MGTQADIGRQTKVILAIVVSVVIAGGYLGYTWLQNQNKNNSSVRGITTNGKGTKTEESEQYRQVLDKYLTNTTTLTRKRLNLAEDHICPLCQRNL